jgi:hypothetical protein
MDVEIVRWVDKTNMDKVVNKSFTDIEEAHKFYANWKCDEYDDDKFLIKGKNWNSMKKENIEISDKYEYLYTYSVNIWNNSEMEHSHNFIIYKPL